MLTPTEAGGGEWRVELDPAVLIPSRPARLALTFTPRHSVAAREVRAALVGTETYRYRRGQTTPGVGGGATVHMVEHTAHDEVGRLETRLAGPSVLTAGISARWTWDLQAPDLGPAIFEGDVLRCDWELIVTVDVPHALDAELRMPVRVAQPTALLRAGVVDAGEYALFEEAPANLDAHPAQIKLAPVPLCIAEPFSGTVTLETDKPVPVQEVRMELRVHAQVTVAGGMDEEVVVARGQLATDAGAFGGPLAAHPFTADAPDAWLPTVDLPHGRARARFHVILARSWAPDEHYVRDVAVCSTTVI